MIAHPIFALVLGLGLYKITLSFQEYLPWTSFLSF